MTKTPSRPLGADEAVAAAMDDPNRGSLNDQKEIAAANFLNQGFDGRAIFTTLSGKPVTDFPMTDWVEIETDAGLVHLRLPRRPRGNVSIVNVAEGARINGVVFGPGYYKFDDTGEVVPATSP